MTRTCLVAIAFATATTPAFAQRITIDPIGSARNGAAMNDIRQGREQALQQRRAQQELAIREQQMISAAAGEVTVARQSQRAAVQDLKKAREQAAEMAEASLGIKAALDELMQAQQALRDVSVPILDKLKATAEYREAEKKSTAALDDIKRLRADKSLSEADRQSRLSRLVAESMAVSNLERVALRKDDQANRARERLEKGQQKVADLKKAGAEMGDRDPGVAAAQQSLKDAVEAVRTAETGLVGVRKKIASGAHLFEAAVVPAGGERPNSPKGNGKN